MHEGATSISITWGCIIGGLHAHLLLLHAHLRAGGRQARGRAWSAAQVQAAVGPQLRAQCTAGRMGVAVASGPKHTCAGICVGVRV
jgi:hypothetical protein